MTSPSAIPPDAPTIDRRPPILRAEECRMSRSPTAYVQSCVGNETIARVLCLYAPSGRLWCELLGHSIVVGKSVERQS
jgi:hypothetical protein